MPDIDIPLVQNTWALVLPIADQAAALFYGRLFELDPSLRRLFTSTDMTEQRKKLMQMITVVVRALNHIDQILPAVEELGRRNERYGVTDAHYDTVGAALLWTLEQGLGDAYTPAVHEAWAATYGTLASVMKSASAEPVAA